MFRVSRGVYSFPVLSSTWLWLLYQDGGRSSWWEIQEHSQQKQRPLGAAHLGDQVREAGGRVRTGQRLALRSGRERNLPGTARRPFLSFWPPQPLPGACFPAGAPRTPIFSKPRTPPPAHAPSLLLGAWPGGSPVLKAGSLGFGKKPGAGVRIENGSSWTPVQRALRPPVWPGLQGATKSPVCQELQTV